jgi:hypothetical protein
MKYRHDIAVYSPDGQPRVVVETKALTNKSLEWAAQLRSNLMAEYLPERTAFFVIALLDRIYFWTSTQDSALRPPDLVLETAQVLQRYLPHDKMQPLRGRESELELSLAAWLDDVARSDPALADTAWAAQLARIGFLEAVRGGEIRVGAAA